MPAPFPLAEAVTTGIRSNVATIFAAAKTLHFIDDMVDGRRIKAQELQGATTKQKV
jgi:hypothetical protein